MKNLGTRNVDPETRKTQEADYQEVLAKMRRAFARGDEGAIAIGHLHPYHQDKVREAWQHDFLFTEHSVRLASSEQSE